MRHERPLVRRETACSQREHERGLQRGEPRRGAAGADPAHACVPERSHLVEGEPEGLRSRFRAGRRGRRGAIVSDLAEEGEREVDLLARHGLSAADVGQRERERLERGGRFRVGPEREEEPHR